MITPNMKILVPSEGLFASLVDAATGEIVGQLPLETGVHSGRKFLEWQTVHTSIDFPEGVMVMSPPPVVNIQHADGHADSAASVDYKPRIISEFERRIERQLQAQSAAMARMMAEHRANNAGEAPEAPLAGKSPDPAPTPTAEPETPVEGAADA